MHLDRPAQVEGRAAEAVVSNVCLAKLLGQRSLGAGGVGDGFNLLLLGAEARLVELASRGEAKLGELVAQEIT